MKREKIHKLMDAVQDIVDGGEGVDGYPYVAMNTSNRGTRLTVYVMDAGFQLDGKFDGYYEICKPYDSKEYRACMEHLDRLIKEHVQKGDVTNAE